MKKLLLTCGVVALLAGAGATQAAVPTQALGTPDIPGTAVLPEINGGTLANGYVPGLKPVETDGPLFTFLFATAQLDKDVYTNELIQTLTLIDLNQVVDDTHATGFAESSAIARQVNTDNLDCGNCAEKSDTITASGNNNVGVVSINQAAGNMNNQGTLVSAAVDAKRFGSPPPPTPPPPPGTPPTPVTPQGEPTDPGFAHAQAEGTQYNGVFLVRIPVGEGLGIIFPTEGNDVETVNLIFRDATITGSLNDDKGLIYANQATGNNNNQLNELSLAFSLRSQGVAIAEADLGQFNTGNDVGKSDALTGLTDNPSTTVDKSISGIGIHKTATITGSLLRDVGIFGVNQTVGNNGNQANIVSIAAVGAGLPSGPF